MTFKKRTNVHFTLCYKKTKQEKSAGRSTFGAYTKQPIEIGSLGSYGNKR